jgi:uncharacterized protein (DUF1501 family)
MDRRTFITSTGMSFLGALSGVSDFALAQTPLKIKAATQNGPLIILFLRGGADGLGILSPLDDVNFQAARSPQMRFDPTLSPVVKGKMNWYWHPSATPLSQLMDAKRLVPWHAVGLTNETSSHFEAQEIMERGVDSLQVIPDTYGMISRVAAQNGMKNDTFLYAGSNNLPRAMQGNFSALAVRDLQNGVPFPGGVDNLKILEELVLRDKNHPAARSIQTTLENLNKIQETLLWGEKKVKPYESAGSSPYPNNDPGVGLRSVARLIQANIGLQYAWVDHGGWDMHEGEPQRMNNVLGQLSQGLFAFDQDMQAQNKKYTMVVMTEFGRRFRSNQSNGTDHGHGGLAMILGSQIPKAQMMGSWPGLNEADLDRGVDLAVTTPYQEVINQALQWGRMI